MSIKSFPSFEIPPVSGNSGKVLTTDGAAAYWGPGSNMTLLGSVNASGTFVSISNIDQSYRDLKIVGLNLRLGSSEIINIRVNGVTGGSYYSVSYISSNSTAVTNTSGTTGAPFAQIFSPTLSATAIELDIYNYADTNLNAKAWRSQSARGDAAGQLSAFGTFNSANDSTQYGGIRNITSVGFTTTNSFDAGTFFVYGVK